MRATNFSKIAQQIIARCDELATITDEPDRITRTFHSAAMQRANALVGSWMTAAGLETREDAAFNLIGRWPSANPKAKTLLLGSHLDTVRDAGKYDGPLGVIVALATIEYLKGEGIELPFNVEIIGFSDEEGVRYQTAYLGSRAIAGTLTKKDLALIEEKGIEKAKRPKGEFFAYTEVHIEQGPVLQECGRAVGVVTAIASQSRIRIGFTGRAGHAGTTPMNLRRDALAGAAEFIVLVEKCGVTATVGQLEVLPGASNVIPGAVHLTLDIRDQQDARRVAAISALKTKAEAISKKRGLELTWKLMQETSAIPCDPALTAVLKKSVARHEGEVVILPSGAGHDGAAISRICPIAMLFVRCKDGISHNPAEAVRTPDVAKAVAVLTDYILSLK